MKNLVFLLFVIILISSCDIVEEPYIEKPNTTDTTQSVVKKVFVEYFTGHRCVNCPTASIKLKELKNQYKDNLIYISIHSGPFAAPIGANYSNDYRTTVGTELDNEWGVTAISTPNALINRKSFDGSVVIPPDAWASIIAQEILLKPKVKIDISEALLNNDKINVKLSVKSLEQIDQMARISVFLVEDSIQSYQKNSNPDIGYPTPEIPDYQHRYVLRASFNGTWGDTIFTATNANQAFSREYSMTYNNTWNKKRLYVVCFVHDAANYEVLQVEKRKVASN